MSLKIISSRDNPVFKEILSLGQDRRARRRARAALIDGPHLLTEALDAGFPAQRLLFSESALTGPLADWLQRLPEVPATALPDRLFGALATVDSPVGLMAVVSTRPAIETARPAGPAPCIVLLDNVQDPGNVGAILRVAAAAGVDAVHLSRGCADVWSPKCLRGGQGAQFRVAIHDESDLPELIESFPGLVHAAMPAATTSLYDLDLHGPVGFIFGNEGAGVGEQLGQRARAFGIPMPGRVESLNVATAAAVCLFEWVRQTRLSAPK